MAKRTVCVVTGNRAEFGLLRPILAALRRHPRLAPRLLVTGAHADPLYGAAIREIRREFRVDAAVPWRYRDGSRLEAGREAGRALARMACVLDRLRPDLVLVLGDRSDILPVAIAAATLGIPVAQLHGGDRSGTLLDNAYRAAIAAFASLHLPATSEGAGSLAARGVPRRSIAVVGAPGIDAIRSAPRMTGSAVRRFLGFPPGTPYLVALQHPVLGDARGAGPQARAVFQAVLASGLHALVVYPNADPGARAVIRQIERMRRTPRIEIRRNLDHDLFVNVLRHAAALVGNSSAGIIEAPFLRLPVVNVGPRQEGRERGANVIDVPADAGAIGRAIRKAAFDHAFRRRVARGGNPYGDGRTAEKTLQAIDLFLKKK